MRFWDSSALIPLLIQEKQTESVQTLLAEDHDIVFWWGTEIECHSALQRRHREGSLSIEEVQKTAAALRNLLARGFEVLPSGSVKLAACRLLAVHSLRAADSMQLAAGLAWTRNQPIGREFVCLDDRLSFNAQREGFTVQPAAGPGN